MQDLSNCQCIHRLTLSKTLLKSLCNIKCIQIEKYLSFLVDVPLSNIVINTLVEKKSTCSSPINLIVSSLQVEVRIISVKMFNIIDQTFILAKSLSLLN